MAIPKKVTQYKNYLISLGYTVTGTYKPKNRKQVRDKSEYDTSEYESNSESDSERSESDEEIPSPKRKTLSPKERAKKFVKDNTHNWRLIDMDCEGNFSKSDLVNFSKRIGVKIGGSPKKMCEIIKKEVKKLRD